MANPTLYKKIPIQDVNTRTTYPLSSDEKTRVDAVVTKFFDLFKAKHLG